MEKFFVQEVLLEQPFAKDSSMSVGEYLKQSCRRRCDSRPLSCVTSSVRVAASNSWAMHNRVSTA